MSFKPLTDEEVEKLIAEHDAKSGALKAQGERQAQSCWDAGIVIHKTCSHMDIPKYIVEYSILADKKIKLLQKSYPSLEWLGYLVGKLDHENTTVFVDDIIVPDQFVTGVNVMDVEYGWNDGLPIIGVIHSHHSMGAFFSGTDDAYINQNHDVSIVVSTSQRSPVKGQVRVKAPCGDYVLAEDLTFVVAEPECDGLEEFEASFRAKIKTFQAPRISFARKGGFGTASAVPQSGGFNESDPYGEDAWDYLYNQQGVVSKDDSQCTLSAEDIKEGLAEFYNPEEVAEFMEGNLYEAECELLHMMMVNAEDGDPDAVWNLTEEDVVWEEKPEEEEAWSIHPVQLEDEGTTTAWEEKPEDEPEGFNRAGVGIRSNINLH